MTDTPEYYDDFEDENEDEDEMVSFVPIVTIETDDLQSGTTKTALSTTTTRDGG